MYEIRDVFDVQWSDSTLMMLYADTVVPHGRDDAIKGTTTNSCLLGTSSTVIISTMADSYSLYNTTRGRTKMGDHWHALKLPVV